VAFFPDHAQSIPLKLKQAAPREDVAVCSLDIKEIPKLPILPLETDLDSVVVGKMVVTMGYPSGPDRLLALLDENEAREVQARYGSSVEALLGYLAEKNRIQPLMTQGNITDMETRKVVYDARTGEGGSGGPLFGPSGRVIGVTYAIFTENTASNFSVPVRYAITLLERAGWKAPENLEGDQTASSSEANPRASNPAAPH